MHVAACEPSGLIHLLDSTTATAATAAAFPMHPKLTALQVSYLVSGEHSSSSMEAPDTAAAE
jgi:hypothetical protein